ncbi:MAG: YciI family protein [Candidatus Velthaea sp.]|jgi:hypothetical protein
MADFIFLMHDDAPDAVADWGPYLAQLQAKGVLQGGSRISGGTCVRKSGTAHSITSHLGGFIRVEATDFDDARTLIAGNPVYEAGGTIEIRELPRD